MAEAVTCAPSDENLAEHSHVDQPLLRLAFTCTPAEKSEASSYMLRRQLGGGSKWRTWAVLLVIAGGLVLRIVQTARSLSRNDRWIWGLALIVIWMILFVFIRKRGRSTHSTQMDVFDWGFRIAAVNEEVVHPWTSLSRAVETPIAIVLQVARGSHFHVVPKRVLPSVDWATWLVDTVAANKAAEPLEASVPPVALPASDETDCILSVEYGPSFLNALDCVLVSWVTKLLALGWIGMPLGVAIYMAFNPPPDAVVPLWKVFLLAEIPAMFVGCALLILVLTTKAWLQNLRQPVQTIGLYDGKIIVQSGDVKQSLPWSGFTHFKETRRSFLMWRRFSSRVLVVPKSEHLTTTQRSACHNLLVRKIKESSWLWSI